MLEEYKLKVISLVYSSKDFDFLSIGFLVWKKMKRYSGRILDFIRSEIQMSVGGTAGDLDREG